jgi:hypothetical protein
MMKEQFLKTMTHSQTKRLMASLMLLISLIASPVEIAAQDNPWVIPNTGRNAAVYAQLSAAWWQWALAIPSPDNPLLDQTGEKGAAGQAGAVWFLAGAMTSDPVEQYCTVPAGRPLFFPIISGACSTLECPGFFCGTTTAQLSECARNYVNGIGGETLFATIDGRSQYLLGRYRTASAPFSFYVPADNILGLAGPGVGTAVSDGYWLLIAPLPAGQHTITFGGAITSGVWIGHSQNITYHLTVRP